MQKVHFADYVVSPGEVRDNAYECAAWYQSVALEPGEHPVYGQFRGGEREDELEDLVSFMVPGTITEDYFQSLWCGNQIGADYDRKKNAGKPAIWRSGTYLHSIAKLLIEGKPCQFRLRPGFEARTIRFKSVFDGQQIQTYGIFRV